MTDNLREQIVCTHRWDTGDSTDPGYCQCQRWANHDGAHHCCCGATDGDSLRDRIAAAMYADNAFGLSEYACAELADAVIAALPELTQPVSVEAIGDYQYVCHPCGSSFSFYSSSTMQQFALMHSGSHNPKSTGADTVGDVNDE